MDGWMDGWTRKTTTACIGTSVRQEGKSPNDEIWKWGGGRFGSLTNSSRGDKADLLWLGGVQCGWRMADT